MRLSAIELRNFKAFGPDLQTIPIKPITLVFGKNSAGKSSLLHSLLWLNHAATRGETDIHEPVAAYGSVNLGGFDASINQTSRRHDKNWLHINLHVSEPHLGGSAAKWLGSVSSFAVKMAIRRGDANSEPRLSDYKIDLDGDTLVSGSLWHNARQAFARMNWSHSVLTPLREKLTKRAMSVLTSTEDYGGPFQAGILTILPKSIEPDFLDKIVFEGRLKEVVPEQVTKKSRWSFKDCRMFIFDTIPYSITPVLEQITEIVTGLRYLPPLRSIPQRFENLKTCRDPAWKKLADDTSLVNSINRTLGNLDVDHLLDVRKLVPEEGSSDPSDYLTQLRIRDTRTNAMVNLQDVGVGTGQVLPIVIEAHACKNRLIIVEQPEVHVHPALQAELGDVFIESALGENKNTFLLETHSEHLLLRIMKRMRQTAESKLPEGMPPVRPEDVALLFVSPSPEGSVVQDIGLNERGELIKAWPGGFFEEGFNEMFD